VRESHLKAASDLSCGETFTAAKEMFERNGDQTTSIGKELIDRL
jgi:hypothetical protein